MKYNYYIWYFIIIDSIMDKQNNLLMQEDLQPSLNIGLIGHVSHGKSSIVKALTGISTGKSNKEVEKNMTIKLGYANAKIWYCEYCKLYFSTNSDVMISDISCEKCFGKCELKRHISFVDCFDPSTKVLMYCGAIKYVSELKVGDLLIGPDGKKRQILNLSTGSKDLYEIKYLTNSENSLDDNKFICTGGHPLVLRMDTPIKPPLKISDKKYIVIKYYANEEILYSKTHEFANLDDANEFYNLDKTPLIFEMTVEAFIMSPATIKKRVRLFHSNGLEFDDYNNVPSISINGASDEEIGWLIGLWIGDGTSAEPKFTIGYNDNEIMEKVKDISKKIGLTPYVYTIKDKNAYYVTLSTCTGKSMYSVENCNENSKNVFTNLLIKLGLLNNKHIGNNLKFQKKTVRESVLAGLIDSDGYYGRGQFEIIQSVIHKEIIDGLIWLIRSIGFTCHYMKKYQTIKKDGNITKYPVYALYFNGKASRLPIASVRKQGKDIVREWISSQPFTVNKKGIGNYIGFELDGDKRFLLGDFIVAHNCPGHEILMSTMLNGSAIMNSALIIIAADQPCPQAQTNEHLIALDMIGIKEHIIIQNKIDLVTLEQANNNYQSIKSFVSDSNACDAPIIPVCANKKLNVDILCKYISEMKVPIRDIDSSPLMIVVRSFDINKPGTPIKKLQGGVMGGSLLKGTLNVGQEIEIRPGVLKKNKDGHYICVPIISEIISLASENNSLECAYPGGLIGVCSLIDPYCTKGDNLVGNIIGIKGHMPSVYVDIEISYALISRDGKDKPAKISKHELLRLNIGSLTVDAKVLALKADLLKLELIKPACIINKSRISLSRKINKNSGWRLIGIAMLCNGTIILE